MWIDDGGWMSTIERSYPRFGCRARRETRGVEVPGVGGERGSESAGEGFKEDTWRMRRIFLRVSVCVTRVHIYVLCYVHGK